tara:strand:+ start:4167 stop:4868 length:702 start_codon:yes stop_codon:yes gene_type:complete
MNQNHITIMKIYHHIRVGAFTLLELLTVISIMAILATIVFPGIGVAMTKAKMAAAMANARSIGQGLRSYASDNSGLFPSGTNDLDEEIVSSNDAFRSLVPEYIDNEKVFSVARSAWGSEADGRIDDPSDILRPGENHYSYIAGLTDTSRSNWPLVFDGTDGSGAYSETYGTKGGCWEGRRGIVAYVGGSAAVVKLEGNRGGPRYLPREGYPEENALNVEYMGKNVTLLDPDEG